MSPIVEELTPVPDVAATLRRFAAWPDVVLFESARPHERLGRYSFLTADPFESVGIQEAPFGLDPFRRVREQHARFQTETVPELPPFQGGAAGVLSYELGGCWERIPRPRHDEFQLPAARLGLYDWVIAWDHVADQAWIISHGFPETEPARRRDRAASRLADVRQHLQTDESNAADRPTGSKRLEEAVLVPQFQLPDRPSVTSDFSRGDYERAVETVIEYIHAGDIFQANLSQRLLHRFDTSPVALYERLRKCNPAPFAGFLAHDDWAVISASPERFVRVTGDQVETRPIKGTRQRRPAPEADLFTRDELRQSEKDIAENVMIVDLLRNDLSRVCEPGSISVPQLCVIESYETVQHLVSEVRGTLARSPDPSGLSTNQCADVWSLLSALFPGGSITGAPKIRAMEIIAEQEPTARGPYCGSLFYAGFDGTLDSSILIRTFVCRHGWVQCSAGGGIVAQSDPADEYEETLHKAEGMLRAFD